MRLHGRLRQLESTLSERPRLSPEETIRRNRTSLEEMGAEWCAGVLMELRRHAPSALRRTGGSPGALDASDEFLAEVQREFERMRAEETKPSESTADELTAPVQ